jgi:hypothetical protein
MLIYGLGVSSKPCCTAVLNLAVRSPAFISLSTSLCTLLLLSARPHQIQQQALLHRHSDKPCSRVALYSPPTHPPTHPACSFTNAVESRTDVTVDLVYFTLGHLRRPGQVQVPRGTKDTR